MTRQLYIEDYLIKIQTANCERAAAGGCGDDDHVFCVCVKGSICNDCLMSLCCGFCVVCQMIRELDSAGWPK